MPSHHRAFPSPCLPIPMPPYLHAVPSRCHPTSSNHSPPTKVAFLLPYIDTGTLRPASVVHGRDQHPSTQPLHTASVCTALANVIGRLQYRNMEHLHIGLQCWLHPQCFSWWCAKPGLHYELWMGEVPAACIQLVMVPPPLFGPHTYSLLCP